MLTTTVTRQLQQPLNGGSKGADVRTLTGGNALGSDVAQLTALPPPVTSEKPMMAPTAARRQQEGGVVWRGRCGGGEGVG